MLSSIKLSDEGSYSKTGETLDGLKVINFIFGTNGTGKTTISRVLANPNSYTTCTLSWNKAAKLECIVFNSDFVAKNFAAQQLPGIFTLGETATDTMAEIESAKKKVAGFADDIAKLEATLGTVDGTSGKRGDLKKLRSEFDSDCWRIKARHDVDFKEAFSGVRSSQSKFSDRVLVELDSNEASITSLEELKRKAATIYAEGLARQDPIKSINFSGLEALESEAVLSKKIVGKEDVDVAALIRRLGNSDWVKQGLSYLDGPQCPFCQQSLDKELAEKLNAYFDETYVNDMASLSKAVQSYDLQAGLVVNRLEEVLTGGSNHIDADAFRADMDRLIALIARNKALLDNKSREPSSPIVLEPLSEIAAKFDQQITAANATISAQNQLFENLKAEKSTLEKEIWKFLLDDNAKTIQKYVSAKGALDKAVEGIKGSVAAKREVLTAAEAHLRELEKKITSVQPTVNEINALLRSFGFTGFSLQTAGDRDHLYKIVRDSGADAVATLSEGEKNFVAFLYFYHLLRGSITETGQTSDRLAVFDDPVSSLDSDVLFIVSALIKRVLNEACEQTGQIKQVFVLTHNIYFHKEVSFDPKRSAECRSHETFWIVRKVSGVSKIFGYDHNPIKTSYELLWNEVRNPNSSNMTIQNTLRRIIENYFKILGNVNPDDIIAKFEGRDKQICASLFSWVNDGSHSVHDDLYVSIDEGLVQRYLSVFRNIFDKTDHLPHYLMMMGTDSQSTNAAVSPAGVAELEGSPG